MKILECKKGQIYDIGFIDCQFVHERTLKEKPKQTENKLLQSLTYFGTRREILFPYSCLTHILFCLLGVKCIIDSLCVCSFHFILLIIVPDEGVVKVMDPGRRSMESWEDMQECLQRAWKRFTAKTPGLPAELTFEPLNVSTT